LNFGPKVLLYEAVDAAPGSDKVMTDWNFLGPLFEPEPNTSFSEWSGNWGYNFEMAGYFPLQDKESEMHFITLGTEGGRGDHGDHWPLWLGGDITSNGSSPTLVPEMAGVLDYGEVYAVNTFPNKDGKRVLLAWTYEDDGGYGMTARGWQGSLLLPRHLSVDNIDNVVTDSSDDEMTPPSDHVATKNDSGTWKVKTLGIQPIPALEKLRTGAEYSFVEATTPKVGYQKIDTLETNHFEMQFQIDLKNEPDAKAGIAIRRSEDGLETTNIWYDQQT
jgi:beta-fructofuranosidase